MLKLFLIAAVLYLVYLGVQKLRKNKQLREAVSEYGDARMQQTVNSIKQKTQEIKA